MAKDTGISNLELILLIVFCILIYFYFGIYIPNKEYFDSGQILADVVKITIIIVAIGLGFVALFFLIRRYLRQREKKRIEKQKKQAHINKLHKKFEDFLNEDYSESSTEKIAEAWKKIKSFVATLPVEMKEEYKKRVNKYHRKLDNYYNQAAEREEITREQKRKEEEREQEEQRLFEEQVEELFEFKKKSKSIDALPLNKTYSSSVINKAEGKMKKYFDEEKWLRNARKEAIEYYAKNNIDSKPSTFQEKEKVYLQIRKDILDGKIIPNQSSVCKGERTLTLNFYRAKEMSQEMKMRADAEGFSYVRGNELDGFVAAGGFYIMKEMKKESSKHFVTKHLFTELHPKMKVEHAIKGKRADVAFVSRKLKLAIEVETGTNKKDQLAEKIQWLNQHFDYWFFVCSRKYISKYNKYVDGKKSFCLPPKKGKEKVLELIHR